MRNNGAPQRLNRHFVTFVWPIPLCDDDGRPRSIPWSSWFSKRWLLVYSGQVHVDAKVSHQLLQHGDIHLSSRGKEDINGRAPRIVVLFVKCVASSNLGNFGLHASRVFGFAVGNEQFVWQGVLF